VKITRAANAPSMEERKFFMRIEVRSFYRFHQ